ncbi:MAG: hypothetical protein JSW11_14650 [Candidatus Heimdallarchaeota archaeon]|nr:MAG: hypothetical protein JSW11_14650 [Candidatus Heimdallarchaeota archaeon]
MKSIPEDIALQICEQIREEKGVRLFSQCWGCVKFSKGDGKKMCFYDPPNNWGCKLVNKQYDRQS